MNLRDLYERALRAYEAAHKVWMSTPVHTEAGKAASASLDRARFRYNLAQDCSWWAVSRDGKNDGSLVPNESFHDWLTIPNITDRQRS